LYKFDIANILIYNKVTLSAMNMMIKNEMYYVYILLFLN